MVHFLKIQNLFSVEENLYLLNLLINHEKNFEKSLLIPLDENKRKSRVLYNNEITLRFKEKITYILPLVQDSLKLNFKIKGLDVQITATEHEGFLNYHTDQTELITNRQITFVYYLHQEPQPFIGGQLILKEKQDLISNFVEIEPKNNSLIFFKSTVWHEVLKVQTKKDDFSCSRFTFNGWVLSD